MEPITHSSILLFFPTTITIQFFTQVRANHGKIPSLTLGLHKITQVGNPKNSIAMLLQREGVEVANKWWDFISFPSLHQIPSLIFYVTNNINFFATLALRPC